MILGDPSQNNSTFRANAAFQLFEPTFDAAGNPTYVPTGTFPAGGLFQVTATSLPGYLQIEGIADGTVIQGLAGPSGFAALPVPASLA